MNSRYRGLTPMVAADQVKGEQQKATAIGLYPTTLGKIDTMKKVTEIDNRSQLVRAMIDFAASRPEEFKEFIESGVKVGESA